MKKLLSLHSLRFAMLALTLSAFTIGCGGDPDPVTTDETPAVKTVTAELKAPAEKNVEAAPVVEQKEMPKVEAPVVAETPAPVVATNASGVSGMVKLDGTPPVMAVIKTNTDPKCHAAHSDTPMTSERVICSKDGGLKNVFITIMNPPAGDHPVPTTPVILDQIGCKYIPHIVGIQVGQTLEVRNSDNTMHNVHRIARKNGQDNKMQLAGSKPLSQIFKKAEDRMRFKCDVHPWMNAMVFVIEHPFFGITDDNGAFSIAGLPAGEYEVKAWHEQYKEQMGTVTVDANGVGTVDFTYKVPAE